MPNLDACSLICLNAPSWCSSTTRGMKTLCPGMPSKRRIVDIARWTPFTEMHVVFESSSRTDRLIEEAFADFNIEENGKAIPVECYFMPKAVNHPGLEVADFVMHAVGRQARRRVEGREGFAPDFAAVFHNQDPKRVSFMEVDRVERAEPGSPVSG